MMPTQTASLNFQFTAAGQNLATQALAGKAQIDFTKAVSSSTNHYGDTAAQAAQLTDLDNKQQTVTVTEVDAIDGDQSAVKIPIVFNKSDIDTDYQLLTIGLYAKPVNGDEVLYAICGLQDPVYMHKTSNSSTYSIDMMVIVGTSANVTLKIDPAGVVSQADLTAALKDYPKTADLDSILQSKNYATEKYVDDKIAAIPQPDTNGWQKFALTGDDGTPKLVVASGEDTSAKVGALIGKNDVGTVSIDIGAKNNTAGHSLLGMYYASPTWAMLNLQSSDGTQWNINVTKSGSDVTVTWTKTVTEDELNAGIQKAIDQAHADMIAELNKRNVPSNFWWGTQAQLDAINPKDANTVYGTQEDDS